MHYWCEYSRFQIRLLKFKFNKIAGVFNNSTKVEGTREGVTTDVERFTASNGVEDTHRVRIGQQLRRIKIDAPFYSNSQSETEML